MDQSEHRNSECTYTFAKYASRITSVAVVPLSLVYLPTVTPHCSTADENFPTSTGYVASAHTVDRRTRRLLKSYEMSQKTSINI